MHSAASHSGFLLTAYFALSKFGSLLIGRYRTYEVIPMTSRIGMIEWMSNTRVLKEMIMSSMSAEDQALYRSKREAHDPQVSEWN